jgi:hypothetical protein
MLFDRGGQRTTTHYKTAIERMGKERRAATLVALVSTLEATAQDDALDVLDIVLTDIFSEASKAGIKARLRTLKDLDAAAVQAGNVSKVVLDPNVADIEIRQTYSNCWTSTLGARFVLSVNTPSNSPDYRGER